MVAETKTKITFPASFKKMMLTLILFLSCVTSASAQEITAIDFNGDLIGKVIPDGNVVSFDNQLIGNITADSLIVNKEGVLIGGVIPQGIAIGNDTKVLGKVGTDGSVRLPSGKIIGKVLPTGLVVDDYYNVIGAVLFPGLVYGTNGQTIGRLAGNGTYTDMMGTNIGYVAPTGFSYRRHQDGYVLDGRLISSKMVVSLKGEFIGSVLPGGNVAGFNNKIIGRIRANDFVYDENNQIIGRIIRTGYAFSDAGAPLGYVSYNGEVINKGESIGRLQADGEIINTKGKHLGYYIDFSATATDLSGRYLGRLLPDGSIVKTKEVIGRLGPRGSVISPQGDIIGWIFNTGAVFDYAGRQRGMVLSSGEFVSLGGNVDGSVRNNQVYSTSGEIIGKVLEPSVVIDLNNSSLGVPNITGFVLNGQERVTPYGYLIANNGEIKGATLPFRPLYSLFGNESGRINLDGSVRGSSGADLAGRLTPAGIMLDERNRLLGKIVPFNIAIKKDDKSFSALSDGNLILDSKNEIIGKVLPDYSIVQTNAADSNVLMPTIGRAWNDYLAVGINGGLLGSVNFDGSVIDGSGIKVGHVMSSGMVLDNNNAVSGAVIPYAPVVGTSGCKNLGLVTPEGMVRNNRDVNVGRILTNKQVVSDSGVVSGYLINPDSVIDYNGNIVGVISANGRVVNYNNEFSGCADSQGRLYKNDGSLVAKVISYAPVMNFRDEIIGRSVADGSVVDTDGRVVGYIQPDNNANSKVGRPIGELFLYQVAFDNSGRYFGRVQSDASIINDDGQIVGKVDSEGFVISGGKKIGYALYDFYIYNARDIAIGYYTKTGEAMSFTNKNLGRVYRGFVIDNSDKVIGRGRRSYNIRDKSFSVLGQITFDGFLTSADNRKLGEINDNGEFYDNKNNLIATANPLQYYSNIRQLVVVDNNGNFLGYLDDYGNVTDKTGKVIGYKDSSGRLVNNNQEVIGRVADNEKVYDMDGNLVGYVNAYGDAIDDNGKIIGRLNDNSMVLDASGNLIGGIGSNWYERVKPKPRKQDSTFIPEIGAPIDNSDEDDGRARRRSLNIALTPDGERLGEIRSDGTVVNSKGDVVGRVMPDDTVMDNDGNIIGLRDNEPSAGTETFIPGGTGPGSAIGIGNDRIGVGPAGGMRPEQQYAWNVAMAERRKNISVGKISSKHRSEAFDGMQKDWSEQGISKIISSWRVDMSEMILADKPIPAVIARSIDSSHPTPVTAFVERNVYAEEGRNVLIPAGSRVIGSIGSFMATSEKTSTSAKVDITWERLIRPDGSIFVFHGLTGDAQGRGGALGYLDQQLFKRYAMPLMTSVLTSMTSYFIATDEPSDGETENSKQQAASDARQNFLTDMNTIFEQILGDKANIRPMTYIPAGTRIIIYPKADLWLRTIERDNEVNTYAVGGGKGLLDGDEGKRGNNNTTNHNQGSQVVYDEQGNVVDAEQSGNVLIGEAPKKRQQQRVVPPPPVYSGHSIAPTGQQPSSGYNPPSSAPHSTTSSSSSNNDVPQPLF